jgi:hypothetical protein
MTHGEDGTMRKGTLSVVVAACLMAVNAGTAMAETEPSAPPDHEVRVVNRYGTTVLVYVKDADGGVYLLGRVAASDFKVMKVPAKLTVKGAVEIEVYPVAPFETLMRGADGIESHRIRMSGHDALNMYVECDLLHSTVEIVRG